MAPSKPEKEEPSDRALTAWYLISCLVCLLIGCVVGSQGVMWRDRAPPAKTEMQYREEAAVQMVRLGFVKWVAACGYAVGKDNGNRADLSKCDVDLGLGEPHYGVVGRGNRR